MLFLTHVYFSKRYTEKGAHGCAPLVPLLCIYALRQFLARVSVFDFFGV